jgi:5-methyltetrahydrofolate--homocysteine methyltransferase
VDSLSQIRLAFDAENPWWQRVLAVTRAAVERWGEHILVGCTDLGGNLDILASLRSSEKLLFDLSDTPEEVDRLVAEITPLWLRYYDELYESTAAAGRGNACWGPCWSPGKGYMLQCDFSYMISPRMFERFVLPDLSACCAHLDYGFYHLDGKGEIPHLDHLLSIERLRGIQWQPGDGQPLADGWLPLLKRIRDGGKLCQVYVTAEGAKTIVRELGGKGFLMHIIEWLRPDQAKAFLDELHSL